MTIDLIVALDREIARCRDDELSLSLVLGHCKKRIEFLDKQLKEQYDLLDELEDQLGMTIDEALGR